MLKNKILKIFIYFELKKIIFLRKFLGIHYVINKLKDCRKDNISKILAYYGATIGIDNHFKGSLLIDNINTEDSYKAFKNLTIGDNCYIGYEVYFDLANKITIKDDVVIGAKSILTTHSDVGDRKMKYFFKRISKEIIIEEASWIGIGSTILNGVFIDKYAIVAAGSVVISNVDSYTMVAGIPAKVKKVLK